MRLGCAVFAATCGGDGVAAGDRFCTVWAGFKCVIVCRVIAVKRFIQTQLARRRVRKSSLSARTGNGAFNGCSS